MSYSASFGGNITLKAMTEFEKKEAMEIIEENFVGDIDIEDLEDGGVELAFSGYGKYYDEEWYECLKKILPYVDFNASNDVEFTGEDDEKWRLRLTPDGVCEDNGYIVYDNEIPYAVCIRESFTRDTQAYFGDDPDADPLSDGWEDHDGPVFVAIAIAESKDAAVKKVAEEKGLKPERLVAFGTN